MLKHGDGCLKEFRARKAAERKKIKESFRRVLPDAFWEHARESRREAKLACAAFRRAVVGQISHGHAEKRTTKQTIEIA